MTCNEPKQTYVFTDSEYSLKCLTTWGDKWQKQGWKRTAKGSNSEIKNLELIKQCRYLLQARGGKTKLVKVKAHTNRNDPFSIGN